LNSHFYLLREQSTVFIPSAQISDCHWESATASPVVRRLMALSEPRHAPLSGARKLFADPYSQENLVSYRW
jgi:hypothetical protein